MTGRPLDAGKLPAELLASLLAAQRRLPPEVRLGPAIGEDACAIDVPAGVLVAASDPITFAAGAAEAGRLAVTVNANDVAVMGVQPRWFLATVLLPPGTPVSEVSALFDALGAALELVGAALVGGHTEITPAVTKPVVVGQMLGCTTGDVITTGGARVGDVVVQIGPVPIEGAAVLAARATGLLDDGTLVAAARALDDPGTCIVVPALAAAGLGATSLHDPTEGGLAGALHELATAAATRIRVDAAAVLWFAPGVAICAALGADPWRTLASGAVLATFPADRAAAAIGELRAAGHPAAGIGVVEPGTGVVDVGGAVIPCPTRDEVARLLESE